MSKNPIRFT